MLNILDICVQAKIYESANSLIYRASREPDNQPIILKILKEDYPTPAELARYRTEYQITKSLDLTGVIKVYDLQKYQNTLVMLMEDFDGESLKFWMQQRGFTLTEFLEIAIALTESLGQIHSSNIIHKDINPSNIVFNPATGQLKIIDFGISTKLTRENPTIKNPNILEGTLAYMSPEQTGRMNRSIDYRSDFYSLGVTFYELLTNKLPFETTDALELVHCHIAKQPLPLSDINSEIPQVVSDIVMKLMAKTAEDRYQSAYGIKVDLENCLQQLRLTGIISDFSLACQDISDKFQLPQKLYGREREIDSLLAAFERVSQRSEMMLIAGYSGIGKSALVQEIYKPITQKRGYFISGKFDQYQRNIPYSAVVNAFQELVKQLLTESDEKLKEWRDRLLAALGINGQIIVDVIPEIELIIGKQPAVPELGLTETQNRFNLVFQNFIKIFNHSSHPLVIFLDDLQWADGASLNLMQLLMSAALPGLFLIGAYRDNEVSSAHPLILTLDEIAKTGATVNRIFLSPLELPTVIELIYDTLNCSEEKAKPLAELVLFKTGGNPFFMNEFLKSLYTERLLEFDFQTVGWQWDLEQIQEKGFTDNVVELMASKIQQLPENAQLLLKLAACIGNQFELPTLASIASKSLAETARDLHAAVAENLVFPLGNMGDVELAIAQSESSDTQYPEYKFVHDRIQQAAYSLIPDSDKPKIHQQIGKLLLQNTPNEKREEKIFDIVNQLNFGFDQIFDRQETDELANFNLIAGKKAKAAAAYQPALNYLKVGLELLEESDWPKQYDLMLALYEEATEAAYLSGDLEQMERFAEVVEKKAKTVLDKVKVIEAKIYALIAQSKLEQTIDLGIEFLGELGVRLPKKPNQLDLLIGWLQNKLVLAGKRIEDLADLPRMSDPYKLAAMRILMKIVPPAYYILPKLGLLIGFQMLFLSVKYGNCFDSIFGYSFYGMIFCAELEDIASGHKFGQLALKLAEQFSTKESKAKGIQIFYGTIAYWKAHLKESLPPLLEAYKSAIETGDLEFASYAAFFRSYILYLIGKELSMVELEMAAYGEVVEKFNLLPTYCMLKAFHQAVLNLLGQSENSCILSGNACNEETLLPMLIEANDRTSLATLYVNKLILCCLFRQYPEALKISVLTEQYLDNASGMSFVPHFYLYDSLTRLALYPNLLKREQKRYLKKVLANQKKMKKWAHHAPMNCSHKHKLVEAELCRVQGKDALAIEYYDIAIRLSKEHEYINETALAYELAANFYLSKGKELSARAYMQEARYSYQLWGAIAKVKDLETKYPWLMSRTTTSALTAFETNRTTNSITSGSSAQLDAMTIVKASQAISGEVVLDKLLEKLMLIVLENAGANSGYLILNQESKLLIESVGTIEPKQVLVRQSKAVETCDNLPISVINYVAKAQQDIILANASQEGDFANDRYIANQKVKSILCTPIVSQGKLIGILYLENNLTEGAFTPERLQVLKLLCSQAAISLENAQLYEAQKEYSQTLELTVQQRTQALQQEIKVREQTETALRKEQEKFSKAFRSSPNPIIITRLQDDSYIEVNDSFCRVYGYSHSEIMGATFDLNNWVNLADRDRIINLLQSEGVIRNLELDIRIKSGEVRTMLVSAEIIELNGEACVLSVINDISDRKRAEEALRESEANLKKAKEFADAANRAKGEFLSKMSHELRTPLNAILGFTQVLERDKTLNLKQQEHLGIISRSGEHLLTLINDVLEMSKIEAGRIELYENTFDFYRLLDTLEEMFRLKAESKGLQLIFDRAVNVPQYIKTDESKLRQVLINLLGNAVKFTEKGGVALRVKRRENRELQFPLCFEVTDTGSGIAPEDFEKLFDPFGQTETGKKSQSGTGLGLPISRQFVQLMGGDIAVSSVLGEGATFKFDIQVKLADNSEVPIQQPTKKAIGLQPNQPKYRISIVDDKWESRLLLVNLLSPLGFELREATNGEEAIAIWSSWKPHLIWMDMQMPVMDGCEATKHIKAQNQEHSTVIIALTASAFEENRAFLLAAGCDDFVSKPFREELILEKMAKYLGVRYLYEEESEENSTEVYLSEKQAAYQLTPKDLTIMSAEWIAQLHRAARDLDEESIAQLAEQIPASDAVIANALADLVKKLRFDTIIDLTQEIANG